MDLVCRMASKLLSRLNGIISAADASKRLDVPNGSSSRGELRYSFDVCSCLSCISTASSESNTWM